MITRLPPFHLLGTGWALSCINNSTEVLLPPGKRCTWISWRNWSMSMVGHTAALFAGYESLGSWVPQVKRNKEVTQRQQISKGCSCMRQQHVSAGFCLFSTQAQVLSMQSKRSQQKAPLGWPEPQHHDVKRHKEQISSSLVTPDQRYTTLKSVPKELGWG